MTCREQRSAADLHDLGGNRRCIKAALDEYRTEQEKADALLAAGRAGKEWVTSR